MKNHKRDAGKKLATMAMLGFVLCLSNQIPIHAQNGAARRPAVAERLEFIRLAKHQAPRGWAISEMKFWLSNHPSPNSECQDDLLASQGVRPEARENGTTFSPGCDWRLQIVS